MPEVQKDIHNVPKESIAATRHFPFLEVLIRPTKDEANKPVRDLTRPLGAPRFELLLEEPTSIAERIYRMVSLPPDVREDWALSATVKEDEDVMLPPGAAGMSMTEEIDQASRFLYRLSSAVFPSFSLCM